MSLDKGDCNSKLVLAGGNYDYCLVEKVECADKSELHRRERFYIESNECVNKNIPGRTKNEYIAAHREEISKQKKEYRDVPVHTEKMIEYQKQYYAEDC